MGASVLVIDDEKARATVRNRLGQAGMSMIEAGNCGDGFLLARKKVPDVVILNMDLEDKGGGAFCRKVREDNRISNIPILALTASGNLAETERVLSMGASSCVSKPFNMDRLLRRVGNLLSESGSSDHLDVPEDLKPIFHVKEGKGGRLGDMAEIHSGITARGSKYRRMAQPGPDWVPVITEDKIIPFRVGEPETFMLLDRLALQRVPHRSEYDVREKVVIRRTAPPAAAAMDFSRHPVASGTYSIVPARGLDCAYLACLLNSRLMDFYFNRVRAVAGNPSGAYLRPVDLEAIPVVLPPERVQYEFRNYYAEVSIRARQTDPGVAAHRRVILNEMNLAIFAVYGMSRKQVQRLTELHF